MKTLTVKRFAPLMLLMLLLSLVATFASSTSSTMTSSASAEEWVPPGATDPAIPCGADPQDVDCTSPKQISTQDFSSASVWGDLRIKNVDGHDQIGICKDWISRNSTETSQTAACAGTPAASNSGWLQPGVNTKTWKGWDDTDGVRIPGNWKLREEVVGPNNTVKSACGKSAFWLKVQPSVPVPGGYMTREFYIIPC